MGLGVILFFTFLIYSPVLRHEFVNWDDDTHITENPMVRSLAPENLVRIFSTTVHRTYIPLSILSFSLEFKLFRLNPFFYHLDNLLLHLMVVTLVFYLALRLGLSRTGAWTAAFLFALHPIHVESVAWATERKDVLYSVFYLGCVLSYLNFLRGQRKIYFIISLFLAFLSILSKPMALSLPLILLLCDWFEKESLRTSDLISKIPFILIIAPFAWITFSLNLNYVGQDANPSHFFPFWAGVFYIKKFFWPLELCPLYIPVLPDSIFDFEFYSTVILIALAILIFLFNSNRWIRLALLWYVLSIFFLLNYDYRSVEQSVADRFMYLPSLGFCFLAGYFIELFFSSSTALKPFGVTLLTLLAVILIFKTSYQIGVWKNGFSLWDYTVQKSPNSHLAYNNRGRNYEKIRDWDKAKTDYKNAITINPHYAKAHKNLAMVYEQTGDIQSAIKSLTNAIAVDPHYSGAYNNRGLLYEKLNKPDFALRDYTLAIESDPYYALGYGNRGSLLTRSGDFDAALKDLNFAIKLAPGFVSAYNNRRACYLKKDRFEDALRDCQIALALDPRQAVSYMSCSEVFWKMDRPDLALDYVRKAEQLGFRADKEYIDHLEKAFEKNNNIVQK